MRVARYWRMKAQQYNLQAVRDEAGQMSMLNRPKLETDFHTTDTKAVKEPAA